MASKTQEFLKQKTDLMVLIDALDVDEVDIVSAAKTQSSLYFKAARYRVQKMRARIRRKSELESIEAEKALIIRKKDRKNAVKRTEGNIKQLLRRDPEYAAALQAFAKAEEEEELAKRLLDAFDYRGTAIEVIARLIGYDVAMEKKIGDYKSLTELKSKVKLKYPGKDPEE